MQDSDQLQIGLESFNDEMRPMQAASAEAPFSSPDYLFEVKWDGLRCIVFKDSAGHVHLQDRGLHDITADVPEVVAAAKRIPPGSVIDGELVATDKDGRPDYPRLRERLAAGASLMDKIPTAYLAFDALYLEEKPLLRQPVLRRRARLQKAVEAGGHIFVPDHIDEDGVELFEACLERGLEGVVGYHEDGRLLPCGTVGGGYDDAAIQAVSDALVALASETSTLDPPPIMTKPVHWVRPELVVSVRYSEWSPDGTLRFPIFNGLRPEVHPAEAVRHRPRVVISGHIKPGSLAYDLTRFPF